MSFLSIFFKNKNKKNDDIDRGLHKLFPTCSDDDESKKKEEKTMERHQRNEMFADHKPGDVQNRFGSVGRIENKETARAHSAVSFLSVGELGGTDDEKKNREAAVLICAKVTSEKRCNNRRKERRSLYEFPV